MGSIRVTSASGRIRCGERAGDGVLAVADSSCAFLALDASEVSRKIRVGAAPKAASETDALPRFRGCAQLMALLSFAMKAISYKLCPAASSLSIKGSFSTEGNILTGLINALASANHLNKAVHRFFCIATLVLASATAASAQSKLGRPESSPASQTAKAPAAEAPAPPPPNAPAMVRLQFPNSDVVDVLHLYEQLTGKKLVMD